MPFNRTGFKKFPGIMRAFTNIEMNDIDSSFQRIFDAFNIIEQESKHEAAVLCYREFQNLIPEMLNINIENLEICVKNLKSFNQLVDSLPQNEAFEAKDGFNYRTGQMRIRPSQIALNLSK